MSGKSLLHTKTWNGVGLLLFFCLNDFSYRHIVIMRQNAIFDVTHMHSRKIAEIDGIQLIFRVLRSHKKDPYLCPVEILQSFADMKYLIVF